MFSIFSSNSEAFAQESQENILGKPESNADETKVENEKKRRPKREDQREKTKDMTKKSRQIVYIRTLNSYTI